MVLVIDFGTSFCALDSRFCDGLVADFVHLIVLQVLVADFGCALGSRLCYRFWLCTW